MCFVACTCLFPGVMHTCECKAPGRHTMHAPLAGFAGAREATVFGAPLFLDAVASLPSAFPGPRYSALGPGFPQQPHGAAEGSPSYRAPASHLTAGAPALPTDVQALSHLVAQQVIQQLWGSHHPPPCRPPTYPPFPVTLHTGRAVD